MSQDRPADLLAAASVGSARLEGLEVPDGDIELADAYAVTEISGDDYLAAVRRRVVEDVPATQA